MATEVCMETHTAQPHAHSRANSEALIFDDLGGCRLDTSMGKEPPTVLITLLTHESDTQGLRRIAESLMRGVAGVMGGGVGIKGQFYGDHTSNCSTIVLTNANQLDRNELTDALLCAYKRALNTHTQPVYQRLVHDVLFLPSGQCVRYEGRVRSP